MTPKSEAYKRITHLMEVGKVQIALQEIEANIDSLPVEERLECQGNYFFYTRQKQEAVNKFEEAMMGCSGYHCARYHYLLGVQEELAKNFEAAFTRYNAAIDIEPTFVDAYVELGGLLVKIGDYEGAARNYECALEFDLKDIRIYFNLMEVYRVLAQKSQEYARHFKNAQQGYESIARELGPLPKHHQW